MKRILLFLSMLLCLTAGVYAQNGTVCPPPKDPGGGGPGPGGNHKPPYTPPPTNTPGDHASPDGSASVDPNEIIGPTGYGSFRWVSINDVLNYTILFENDPVFATANAQKVNVSFPFAAQLGIKGFGLGAFGFANHSFNIDNSPGAYQDRLDMRESMSIYVDFMAAVDVVKQQAFWQFNSIDPETGIAPWQSDRGVLPVNDSTHIGEGFVTFTLKPRDNLHTGDTISIQASIVFDQNDTIPTNRWTNKIDAGNPNSRMTAELHPTLPNVYNLKFTGQDDEGGSGLKHLLIYLANHNGIYEEIDTVAVDSVLAFPVEAGKQYKLYSIAVDNTGNREPTKEEPDVILNFNQAPTDIALSDTIFQDDLEAGGFVGKLTSVDSEDEKSFTYALAEGDGAVHNDLFQITEDRLEIKNSFKCADGDCFNVRISTTDNGGLSFSKAFKLNLEKVLVKPKADTLKVDICEGESCLFHGMEYDKTGNHNFIKSNDYMCDSIYVLQLTVHKPLEMPVVTVEESKTLVSSAAKGNQWFRQEGSSIEGATAQKFTPEEDGIFYVAASNGFCFSEPSLSYEVKVTDDFNLKLDLKKGWNWVSSNLSDGTNKDAVEFLKPIEGVIERLVGDTDELINDPIYGLTGGLTTLAPEESYKLKVSENINNVWSGNGSNPETAVIKLKKGWNWIGYVPYGNHEIANALANLTPSENDVVKGMDEFSTYTGGQWVGTLTQLKPGVGYMYYATNATEFKYPSTRVFPITEEANQSRAYLPNVSPWKYDSHKYPDNTTLIGQLNIDDMPITGGIYTVGAFCNNECRGIGRYIGNELYLTIHGTIRSDQKITFKAWENITDTEYDINETINFQGQQVGSNLRPFILHANDITNINQTSKSGYTIYPKPLRDKLYINGETDDIKTIKILSSDGNVNINNNGYSEQGIDVSGLLSGVYIVAIIAVNGEVYYEKVIKAQNN